MALQLRKEVLLDPYGIDHETARADDSGSLHMGIFDDVECQACLFLVPRTKGKIQMRQVAVAPKLQRTGLGRRLVEFAEHVGLKNGSTLMTAHARDSAVPFYQRLGYQVRREPFVEVGIQHRLVEKILKH